MRTPKCDCSQCKLYVRVAKDVSSNSNEYNLEDAEKAYYFQHREYQQALLKQAKEKNIIACLPTGSGKTFIALKLMQHFSNALLTEDKKIFFVANTIPLVNQQAAFFTRHTFLKVRHITGDMEVDYWSEEKWRCIIEGFHIMVMTAQIFLNLLRHGYVKFRQMALIVFDECHHGVKEHPMNQIMREYHRTKQDDPNYSLPRILGLSATIIKGNCKPNEVVQRVKELEGIMDSLAVTYEDYEEVMQHSTNAKVDPVVVSDSRNDDWYPTYLIEEIKQYSKELQKFRNERRKQKALMVANFPIDGIHTTLRNANNVYLTYKKPSPGDLKVALDDVQHAYEELGPFCAVIAINLRLAFIEFSLMDLNNEGVKKWYRTIKAFFIRMREILLEIMRSHPENERVITYISPKLKQLVAIICRFRDSETDTLTSDKTDNSLCGLVFVDRRATAQVLAWYLKDLSAYESTTESNSYKFIRANFVVGTSRCPFETVESRVYAKKQTETINKFRKKTFNILTATSVLEEGIDVPSCNIVVRFDPISTYTSYIQSMGRARMKDASYIVLLTPENQWKERKKIETFNRIHDCLVSHLRSQVMKVDHEETNSEAVFPKDQVPPLCPGETPDSPKVTMDSAAEVIDRHCMLLPCDGVSTLQTISWFQGLLNGTFQAYLKLPVNSVVKQVVEGIPMKTKELAKQAVYLEGAKKLYEASALDENLIAVHPTFPAKVEAFFNILTPNNFVRNETEEGEIFEIKADWYSKRIPRFFSEEHALNFGSTYNVVHIHIEMTKPAEQYKWKNLFNIQDKNVGFGLITANELPDIGSFPLYGGFGRLSVSLKTSNIKVNLEKQYFYKLKEFQEFAFERVLGLQHPLFRKLNRPCFMVVPLINNNGHWTIYDDVLEKIYTITSCQRMRPPANARTNSSDRFVPKFPRVDYKAKYENAIVLTWYKKPKPLYFVDSVEENMTPLTPFYDGNYTNYQNFYECYYKQKISDKYQPLLKCKLAGLGDIAGRKGQTNYLLEKYAKEEEFPIYLVPELCHILPVPASLIVQLKLVPSILHRMSRLLLAKEILIDVGKTCNWKGALSSERTHLEKQLNILSMTQENQKIDEENRREKRKEIRNRIKPKQKAIIEKLIGNRELQYEFIHPNKITVKDIKLFHEAVSSQHSAKKLTIENDIEIIDAELTSSYKMDLPSLDEINLPLMDVMMDFENHSGPTEMSIMEAISIKNSKEGISNQRYVVIGRSFLNYAVSAYCFSNFPLWSEPLMCQLRNRLLSIQCLCAVAKKQHIAEILAGSVFFPNDSWTPPGFKLKDGLGEIAAEEKVHLGVYDEIIKDIEQKSQEELRTYVQANSQSVLQSSKAGTKDQPPVMKRSTYTHAEISDVSMVNCVNAMVGTFFTQCGPLGAFKYLESINFRAPDLNGNDLYLQERVTQDASANCELSLSVSKEMILKLLPGLETFENLIGYRFKNKKHILDALSHPTYPANTISDCYQRLEFLGDSILDLLVTNYVYSSDKLSSDEQLADICSALINSVTYASLAVRYGFHKHLLSMSQPLTEMIDNFIVYQESVEHQVVGHFTLISDEECWGPKHMEVPKVLGDLFEAVAGAIYLDSNKSLDTVWKVYYRLMQNEIDNFFEEVPKSPIRELKEKFGDEISFKKVSSKKIRARGRNKCEISIGRYGNYFGCGTNVDRAKFAATKLALKLLKEEDSFTAQLGSSNTVMLMM